jgi:hypothetical protein
MLRLTSRQMFRLWAVLAVPVRQAATLEPVAQAKMAATVAPVVLAATVALAPQVPLQSTLVAQR